MLILRFDAKISILYCLVSVEDLEKEEYLYLLRSLDYGKTWINSLLIDVGTELCQWELVNQSGKILMVNHQKRHKVPVDRIFPQILW